MRVGREPNEMEMSNLRILETSDEASGRELTALTAAAEVVVKVDLDLLACEVERVRFNWTAACRTRNAPLARAPSNASLA